MTTIRVTRNRRTKTELVIRTFVNIILTLVAGWALMAAVDIANDEWLPNMHGLGWWDALLISILLRTALLIPSIDKD